MARKIPGRLKKLILPEEGIDALGPLYTRFAA